MAAEINLDGGKVINAADAASPQGYVTKSQMEAAISSASSAVTSVNGLTGAVTLASTDINGVISSDTIYTVGTGGDFATLEAARTFLKGQIILPKAIVTLHGLDEVHNYTSPYMHDLGENVNYTGVEFGLGFQSIDSVVSHGIGNHTVTINVTSSANCTVGRFLKIRGVTGTGECETLEGVWPITAIPSGTKVSIKVTDQRVSIGSLSVSSLSEFRVIRTVYKFTGCSGFVIEGRLGTISRLACLGTVIQGDEATVDTYGIYGNDGAKAYFSSTKFGVYGFKDHNIYGFRAGNASLSSVASCNSGGHGIYLLNNAQSTCVRTVANGNKGDGVVAATGAQVELGLAVTCGNYSDGITASTGGNIIFSGTSKYNTAKAINAINSDVFITNASIKGEVYAKDCRGYVNNSTIDGDLNADSPEVTISGNTVSGSSYGEEKTVGSTIVWTGTTNPSGATNHKYKFRRTANKVDFAIRLEWANAGSGLTSISIDLPSDMPIPSVFTGQAAGDTGLAISGWLAISSTALPTAVRGVQLAQTSGGVWQIQLTGTAAAYIGVSVQGHYYI